MTLPNRHKPLTTSPIDPTIPVNWSDHTANKQPMETNLKVIKHRRVFQDVAQQIRDLIHDEGLKAGDRLPAERDLAEQLQISRSSLREAMGSLELQEIVVRKPGAGTFVRAQAPTPAGSALVAYLTNGKDALLDIFEMRRILEPQIAALAADRATPDDIGTMEEMLAAQAGQIGRGETGTKGDTAFHFAMAQATQNSALVKVVSAVADILGQSREQPLQAPGRPQRSLASHRYILDMIKQRDPEGAREAMEHHILVVEPFHIPTPRPPRYAINGRLNAPKQQQEVVG